MKSVTKGLLGGIALFIALFSVNVFSQEASLSQDKIIEIQDRVNSMPEFQLNDRRVQLLEKIEELEEEQSTSQSPVRLKTISMLLSECFAELDMIQKAIIVFGGSGILGALTDDDSRDTTPPVISLNGPATVTVERGTTYSDAGATANGGETVTTNLGGLNTNVAGTYTITYSATDNSGNTGYANRTVNVLDTIDPVVSVTGTNPVTIELGDTYTDAGATTTEGTVTSSGTVDTSTVGVYTITYSATDASGNTGTATRTVNVVDTTGPTITIAGDNPVSIEQYQTYTDAGATAADGETVTVTGTVDTSTPGTYTITYTATDTAGNVTVLLEK
jgi:hypothetical protein